MFCDNYNLETPSGNVGMSGDEGVDQPDTNKRSIFPAVILPPREWAGKETGGEQLHNQPDRAGVW